MRLRQFAGDVATLAGAQGLITVAAIGTSVVISRALGPEGRGQFGLSLLFASVLVTFTDFGIGSSGPRFMAGRKWKPTVILASHSVAGILRVLVVGSLGLLIISLGGKALFPGVPTEFLVLGLFQLIPATVAGFILPLFLGLGRADSYSQLLVGSSWVSFGALYAVWTTVGLDVRAALVVQVVAGVVTAAAISIVAMKAAGGWGEPSGGYLRSAYRFGTGVYLSNVAWFANVRLVLLLINGYVGVAGVGFYTLAQTAAERIYLLADATGTALLPRVAEDPARNSRELTPVVFRFALLISGATAVCLSVVAEWFVRTLYSTSFIEAVPVLRLLLVSVVLSSGWRVLSQDLNGRGHSSLTAMVSMSAAMVNLVLAAMLLPRLGLVGAGWSAIASAGWALVLGMALFGGHRGIAALLTPSQGERSTLAGIGRIASYVGETSPDFAWRLIRAYVLDQPLLRAYILVAPLRRRVLDVLERLNTGRALREAHRAEKWIAARSLKRATVALDELGLEPSSRMEIEELLRNNAEVVLGEYDHYGWLLPDFGPVQGIPCRRRDCARKRCRNRVWLVATQKGIGVRKRYGGADAERRFLAEIGALERLRHTSARVPELMDVDVERLVLTETFIPGPDLERLLETVGAQLTGEAIKQRLGNNASCAAIAETYMSEGAAYASRLGDGLRERIYEQVKAVHRAGVQLQDIKYGNIVVHRDSGLPFLIDFDSTRLHHDVAGSAFLVERDRDVERLNCALGTSFPTFKRLRERLRKGQFPGAGKVYASAYIGHGLHVGSLWDRSTGFGRWHYVLKHHIKTRYGDRVLSLGANNGSVELELLRTGVREVVAYEIDRDYVGQGRFLAGAFEWADNVGRHLEYVTKDMREASTTQDGFDVVLALCSLYYLSAAEMRALVAGIAGQAPRIVLQCNVREKIGREDADQYRRASTEMAVELLEHAGCSSVRVVAPHHYSRPLVLGETECTPVQRLSLERTPTCDLAGAE